MGLKLRNGSGGSATLKDLSTQTDHVEIDVRELGIGGRLYSATESYKTGDMVFVDTGIALVDLKYKEYISTVDNNTGKVPGTDPEWEKYNVIKSINHDVRVDIHSDGSSGHFTSLGAALDAINSYTIIGGHSLTLHFLAGHIETESYSVTGDFKSYYLTSDNDPQIFNISPANCDIEWLPGTFCLYYIGEVGSFPYVYCNCKFTGGNNQTGPTNINPFLVSGTLWFGEGLTNTIDDNSTILTKSYSADSEFYFGDNTEWIGGHAIHEGNCAVTGGSGGIFTNQTGYIDHWNYGKAIYNGITITSTKLDNSEYLFALGKSATSSFTNISTPTLGGSYSGTEIIDIIDGVIVNGANSNINLFAKNGGAVTFNDVTKEGIIFG